MRHFLKITFFILLSYIISPVSISAQKILSLEECVTIALKNNSQYKNALNREKVADSQILSAYSSLLPKFNVSLSGRQQHLGSLTRYYNTAVYKYDDDGKAVVDEEGKPVVDRYVRTLNETEPQINNSFNAGASYSQLIYDGGQWWNQIKRQYSNKESREYSTKTIRLSTITDVKRNYYELLKAKNQLVVLNEAVNLAEEQFNNSKTRFDIGSVAEIDVLRAQVNLNNVKIQVFSQENAVEIARINLNTVLGLEPNNPIAIYEDSTLIGDVLSLEESLTRGEKENPSIKMTREEIDKARYAYKSAKSGLLPTISAEVSYSRFNPNVQLVYRNFDRNYSWSYGVNLSLPLFDGLRTKSDIQYESYNLKIAEENYTETKRVVKSNIQKYHKQLNNNLKKIKMMQENLSVAEENVRLAQERYMVGSGTLLETIDAQVSFTQAKMDFVGAVYDAKIVQAQLHNEVGKESY